MMWANMMWAKNISPIRMTIAKEEETGLVKQVSCSSNSPLQML